MSSDVLLKIYSDLVKTPEIIYVFPHIGRSSQYNQYLSLLYAGISDAGNSAGISEAGISEAGNSAGIFSDAGSSDAGNTRGIAIRSGAFFNPLIVFKKFIRERSVVHHHWFECRNLPSFLNALWKLLWLYLYRLAGGRIVWTVHNKFPHNRRMTRTNVFLRRLLARLSHRLLVHCAEAVGIMAPVLRVPAEKFSVVAHPDYPVIEVPRADARRVLGARYGMEGILQRRPVYLMFGYVARYKGVAEVMESIAALDADCCLIVAGAIKGEEEAYGREAERISAGTNRIFMTKRTIPDEDIPYFFSAADYVVFNFSEILYSGAVHMALNYKKNIIIPETGCLKELDGDNVIRFSGEGGLAAALQKTSSKITQIRRSK
jgi:beta-1,4-mannosyltransferase